MHKCSQCGFLASYSFAMRQHLEVDEESRRKGTFNIDRWPGGEIPRMAYVETFPVCFARAASLQAECKATAAFAGDQDKVIEAAKEALRVITRDRECAAFTPWQQGFSPKEHKEMLIDELKADIARQIQERDHRFRWLELIIMGGVLTVVSVATQIAVALLPYWLGTNK